MIREPYNLNPYNSTIDTSKVNNFSFTFSGDELGSWNIEIAKNNTSPEIVYTSEEFVPEDVGYTHIYDGDIVEGITLPSTIAHSQGDDGLLRRLYSINGYPFDEAVVKLNVNGIENIGNIKGSTTNGYLVATNYSLGRTGDGVTIIGFDKDGTTIGSQVADGTYDFLGYLLSVKTNSNIQVGQAVQIEGNSFIIGSIEDVGDGYSELTIVNGEATFSDTASIASFDSLAEADVTELTVGIEPIQDLNGYDKPWVGGAGKNKLPYPYYETSTTRNGVTFTVNTDGTVTANGTATGLVNFTLNNTLTLSGNYILSGCPSGGSAGTYRMDCYWSGQGALIDSGSGVAISPNGNAITTRITAFQGVTMNNVKFYPMIRLATETDATWQPYSNICPITGHDEVRVTRTGKNLLRITASSQTSHGVTFTVNSDGTVLANGTANGTANIFLRSGTGIFDFDSETVLSGSVGGFGNNVKIRLGLTNPVVICDDFGNGVTIPRIADISTRYAYVRITIASGTTVNNLTFRPMIRLASETDATYEPYRSNTYTTSLGQTVYGGTLDVVSGVLTVDKAMVDLGSLSWNENGAISGGKQYATVISDKKVGETNFICSAFATSCPITTLGYICGRATTKTVAANSPLTTLADFVASVTGQTIVYELETPQTYTLTAQQIKTLVGTNNVWASSGDIVNITFKYNIN